MQVRNAITRQKKEQIVSTIKEKIQDSVIVFGFRYKGLDVPTVQKFRKGLPEQSSVMVCKNTLMRVAANDVEGWSVIGEKGCTGENAWVFVSEECIADTVKHYFKFEAELEAAAKAAAPKGAEVAKPTELSMAVMDSKYLSAADLKRCEALPTKKQLYGTIAALLKQPATKLARGIKMVPTKLAIGLKKISELDDDKTKTCAEVAQPAGASA